MVHDLDYQSPKPPGSPLQAVAYAIGATVGIATGAFIGGWLPLRWAQQYTEETGYDGGNAGLCCIVTIPSFAIFGAMIGLSVTWLVLWLLARDDGDR